MPQLNITTSSNSSDSFRTQIPSIIVEQNKLQTLPGSTDSASPVVVQATTPVTYAQEAAKTTLPAPISSIQHSSTSRPQVTVGKPNKSKGANWLLIGASTIFLCGLFAILLYHHKRTKT